MSKSKTEFAALSREFDTSRILDNAGLGVMTCLEEGIGAVVLVMGAKIKNKEVVLTQTLGLFSDNKRSSFALIKDAIENPNSTNWGVYPLED